MKTSSLVTAQDLLLVRHTFGGELSEQEVQLLTDGLVLDTADFWYLQYLSVLGTRTGWKYFPSDMIPRLQGIHRYFQVRDSVGLLWLGEQLSALSEAGIPVMLLGDDAIKAHYAPTAPKVLFQHTVAVPSELGSRAEDVLKAQNLFLTHRDANFSIWVNYRGNGNENLLLRTVFADQRQTEQVWARAADLTFRGLPLKVIAQQDLCLFNLDRPLHLAAGENPAQLVRSWLCNCRYLYGDTVDVHTLAQACANRAARYHLRLLLESYALCFPHAKLLGLDALPDEPGYARWKSRLLACLRDGLPHGSELSAKLKRHRLQYTLYRLSYDGTEGNTLSSYLSTYCGADSVSTLLRRILTVTGE